jgi:hypothetical protein
VENSGDYRVMTEWQVNAHHRDETCTLGSSLSSSTHSDFIAAAVIFVTDSDLPVHRDDLTEDPYV